MLKGKIVERLVVAAPTVAAVYPFSVSVSVLVMANSIIQSFNHYTIIIDIIPMRCWLCNIIVSDCGMFVHTGHLAIVE